MNDLDKATLAELGGEERFLDVKGFKIHCYDFPGPSADAPAVVMLHGGGPGATGMSNFRSCIGEFVPTARVVVYDHPGFGASDKPAFEGSFFPFAAGVLGAVLDALDIRAASIIGNSLGGGVATAFALGNPDRIASLVLMNPAGTSIALLTQETHEMGLIRTYYDDPGPSVEKVRAFVDEMVYDKTAFDTEALVAERYEASVAAGAEEGMLRALGAFDPRQEKAEVQRAGGQAMWQRVDQLDRPVLLVWGREDRAAPLDRCWFLLSRIRNAQLHVFPQCGHWVQIERPAEFAAVANAFFAHAGDAP